LFGVVIVTLCPAGSTQPVASSGEVALGAAATQMVCDMSLTNVTSRRSPDGWPAAPEGGGSEAAGTVEEVAPVAAGAGCVPVADADVGSRASVGAAVRGAAAARFVADAAAAGAVEPAVAVAVTRPGPPAALVPNAAQPAVKVTAASAAASANARAGQVCRLALPRFPRPARTPSATGTLPLPIRSLKETGGVTADNAFLCGIFRYPRPRVVSPSCDANSTRG
jgi:hypothetical protein